MTPPIQSIDCLTLGSLTDELTRLVERGFVATAYINLQGLETGEFRVSTADPDGPTCVYYRE